MKLQANELLRQRRDLAAQLGASLYDTVKDMPELVEGRETLFQSIADIDVKRIQIDAEIAEIEAEIAAQREASMTFKCPSCGTDVSSADMFCSGCGISIAEAKAAHPELADGIERVAKKVNALPPAGKPAITSPTMNSVATSPEAGRRPLQATAGKRVSPLASRPCRAAN